MELDNILAKYSKREDQLIEILLDYQASKDTNFISEKEIVYIANYLNITQSKVCSVMSFYTLLSTNPRGRHIIQVCTDVSCFVCDEINTLKILEHELMIKVNETTKDRMFTLEFTSCIGCCNEAPAMRVNDQTYTNLTEEKIIEILSDWREK